MGDAPARTGSTPIRIVRVIARLNTGGPAIHAVLLTHGLNGGRFRSRLVTGSVASHEGDMSYFARRMNVEPTVLTELGRDLAVWNDLRSLVRLWRVLREERPAILHTHTTKAGALGRVAGVLYNLRARLTGSPRVTLVHSFHGHVFHGYFSTFWSTFLVVGERLLARVTDRVLAVSEAVKQELVERYRICPGDKVRVVPLGLDFGWVQALGDYTGALRGGYGIPPEAVTVGIVGRLTGIKNHRLLLSALRLLERKDVRVLILGDGELRAELATMVEELRLEEVVTFTGWQEEPARIYADLDLICLTSRNEGTPVALIEGMAAGRAVVATRVGGVPDLMVGEPVTHPEGFERFANGILVPPDDPESLAQALRYLIDRPALRRSMGAVGQAAVVNRFSKERLVGDMERIYDELLDRREGGR